MSRYIKHLEINKEYTLKFMPNKFDPGNSIVELQYLFGNHLSKRYFAYVLQDGEAVPYQFSRSIYKMIQQPLHGFWGNSEGFFIAADEELDKYPNMTNNKGELDKYFANDDFSKILLDEELAKKESLTLHTDVVFHEQKNPFDLTNGLEAKFKTMPVKVPGLLRRLMDYSTCQWVINDPVWKEGDDKEAILSMYNNSKSLNDIIEIAKNDIIESAKKSKVKYAFGEDARKQYWETRMQNK